MRVVFLVGERNLEDQDLLRKVEYVKEFKDLPAAPQVGENVEEVWLMPDRKTQSIRVGVVINRSFQIANGSVTYFVEIAYSDTDDIGDIDWAENLWHTFAEGRELKLI